MAEKLSRYTVEKSITIYDEEMDYSITIGPDSDGWI
jgi:hypothetical protein